MSLGDNHKPYRSACGRRDCFAGSFWQHGKDDARPRYVNITTQKDHCGHVWPTPQTLIFETDECGAPACAPCSDCVAGVAAYQTTANTPQIVSPVGDDRGSGEVQNNWQETGTINFKVCRDIGFKSVQGLKWWHGAFPFTYDATTGKDCATETTFSNTKYMEMNITASTTCGLVLRRRRSNDATPTTYYIDETDSMLGSETITHHTRVNRQTGIRDFVTRSYAWDAGGSPIATALAPYSFLAVDNLGSTSNYNGPAANPYYTPGTSFAYQRMREDIEDWVENCGTFKIIFNPAAIGGAWDIDGDTTNTAATAFCAAVTAAQDQVDATLTTFNIDAQTIEVLITLTPKASHSVSNGDGTSWLYTGTGSNTWHMKINLVTGSEYTAAQVQADAIEQLAAWNLTDKAEYPWRHDNNVFVAPFVTRSEHQLAVSPIFFPADTSADYTNPTAGTGTGGDPYTAWGTMAWVDEDCYYWQFASGKRIWGGVGDLNPTEIASGYHALYTGTVTTATGAPLPAGYYEVWDYDHEVWNRRECSIGDYRLGRASLGSFNPVYLPRNAPRWTPDGWFAEDFILDWPCAFIYQGNQFCFMQKFVETLIPRPSYNFARPYGADRFVLDEAHMFCVFAFTAGVVFLDTLDGLPATDVTGDFAAGDIVGGTRIGGFYEVASVSGGNVTLGALKYPVPMGWNTPSGDGATCFGKLKYYKTTGPACLPPGFGGILPVLNATYASGPNLTTFTVAASPYIMTGDKVDVAAFGLSILGTAVTLTRTNDTTFTASGDYSAAKMLVPNKLFDNSRSGQEYFYANDTSKGDFVWREWNEENEAWTVLSSSATQGCLKFVQCTPSVVGGSPNEVSADFENASIHAFPTINNGRLWLGQCEQQMVDPLYQTPHSPCDLAGGASWLSDDGTCHVDDMTHIYYRFPPVVEARVSLPTNCGADEAHTPPALPLAIDLAAYVLPPGHAVLDTSPTSVGHLPELLLNPLSPWELYERQLGCVCADGRFALDYENDDIRKADCGTV